MAYDHCARIGFPLREELGFTSTPGHDAEYLNDLLYRFNGSRRIKKRSKMYFSKCHEYSKNHRSKTCVTDKF